MSFAIGPMVLERRIAMAQPQRKGPKDAIVDLLVEDLRAILRALPEDLREVPPKKPKDDTDSAHGEGETPPKDK